MTYLLTQFRRRFDIRYNYNDLLTNQNVIASHRRYQARSVFFPVKKIESKINGK